MAITEQRLATMVLVIGTGRDQAQAAIELAEAGVDVLAVGKRPKEDAHTALAAGGINAALATMDPEDSWQQHAADTLKESYLLADPRTVEIVTPGAPGASTTWTATAWPSAGGEGHQISSASSARTVLGGPPSPVTTPVWRSSAR